jgi:hypothetical protein
MPATYYVTADYSRIVPEGSPEAAFGIQPKDLARYGLTPPEDVEQAPAGEVLTMGADEPVESKQADAPEDKQAEPVEDKAVRKRGR